MASDAPPPVFYMHPPAESHDAYKIWQDCCLPEISNETDIYWALDNWARLNAVIEYKEKGPFLTWWSLSRTKHTAYAETFARWFICACRRPTPVLVAPPPQLLGKDETLDRPELDLSDSVMEINIHADSTQIDEKIDKISALAITEEDAKPLLQADLEAFLNDWE